MPKQRIYHISEAYEPKTLCGRKAEFDCFYVHAVLKCSKLNFCKVCKSLFNANYSHHYKKKLK